MSKQPFSIFEQQCKVDHFIASTPATWYHLTRFLHWALYELKHDVLKEKNIYKTITLRYGHHRLRNRTRKIHINAKSPENCILILSKYFSIVNIMKPLILIDCRPSTWQNRNVLPVLCLYQYSYDWTEKPRNRRLESK